MSLPQTVTQSKPLTIPAFPQTSTQLSPANPLRNSSISPNSSTSPWDHIKYTHSRPALSGSHYVSSADRIDFKVPVDFNQVQEMNLILFANETDDTPRARIPMKQIHSYGLEHFTVTIAGEVAKPGLVYAYEVSPNPFNTKWVFDPFSFGATPLIWLTDQHGKYNRQHFTPPKSIVVDIESLPAIEPLARPIEPHDRQIYELHIGMSNGREWLHDKKIPDDLMPLRGKLLFYASDFFIETVLLPAGYNTVQIMPPHMPADEFDLVSCGKKNEWKYNPLSTNVLDPEIIYGSGFREGIEEFRHLVSRLHHHGNEAILDFVCFHNGEGSHDPKAMGPTYSLRALGMKYAFLHNDNTYFDETGCGHTISLHDRIGKEYILQSRNNQRDIFGVGGIRIDQAAVGAVQADKSGTTLKPDSRSIKELLGPGRDNFYIVLEPNTIQPPYAYPGVMSPILKNHSNVFEHHFDGRDLTKPFFAGVRSIDYNDNGNHVFTAIIPKLAYSLSGNTRLYDPNGHGGVNKGVQFLSVHDGEQAFDFALKTVKRNYPCANQKTLLEEAVKLVQAMHLSVFLSMGPISVFADSENLHSTIDIPRFLALPYDKFMHEFNKSLNPACNVKDLDLGIVGNSNPYNEAAFIPYQCFSEDPYFNTLKQNFRNFFVRGLRLRHEEVYFKTIQSIDPSKLLWFNRDGEDFQQSAKDNSLRAWRWEGPEYLDGFFGMLFMGNRFESFGKEEPAPLYVARTQNRQDCFVFPDICPKGFYWQALIDSTDIYNNISHHPDEYIFSGGERYSTNAPATVAARLIREDQITVH